MIIGLCGKPLSGKTEAARILESIGFEILDTKEKIRNTTAAFLEVDPNSLKLQSVKKTKINGVEYRKLMGEFGKVVESLLGDDYLLNMALHKTYKNKHYVVDALRLNQTKSFPGLVIEIQSERGIDTGNDFDLYDRSEIYKTINNDGSLMDLKIAICKVLESSDDYVKWSSI